MKKITKTTIAKELQGSFDCQITGGNGQDSKNADKALTILNRLSVNELLPHIDSHLIASLEIVKDREQEINAKNVAVDIADSVAFSALEKKHFYTDSISCVIFTYN